MKRASLDNTLFSLLIVGLAVAVWPTAQSYAEGRAPLGAAHPADRVFPEAPAVASYAIEVQLEPDSKLLTGREWITYTNTTPAPIPDLIFHLYLNAFRDLDSYFLQEGSTHRMNEWDPEAPGWIEISSLRTVGGELLSLELLEDDTLARATLPVPIPPGAALSLEIEFQAQLPRVFARTGFAEDAQGDLYFMVGQWFPKLAVWEETGWNAYPFTPNAEFFANFGVYDVAITLPGQYVTAATGVETARTAQADGRQTVQYHAAGVIDFAWAASPNFKEAIRQVDGVELVYVYLPEHQWTVSRVLDAAESALRSFGEWYGPYPYPRLSVLDTPESGEGAGGMEYPTLVTAGAFDGLGLGLGPARLGLDRTLEMVVIHEVGHQWWQSMVAFNEVLEPWLDEGFTEYSSTRVFRVGNAPTAYHLTLAGLELDTLQLRRLEYVMQPTTPMYGAAWEFDANLEYSVAAYGKPALALTTLENIMGEETMLAIMRTFFQRYQFAHPTTADFRAVAEEISGQDLEWFFEGLVFGSGTLNYAVQAIDEHSVTVVRQGELRIPTEVLITFAGGEQVLEAWDGVEAEKVFSYPDRPAVQSAWVDPERKILVDLVWMDNGLARRPDLPAWLAVFTRIWAGLHGWILALGGL